VRAALALSIVVSAATLFAVGRSARRNPETPPLTRPAPPRPTRTPLHPALRRLLVSDCLVRLCEGLPSVFLVLWALEVVGVTPAEFGLLHSIGTAAAIAAYLPGVAWRGAGAPKALVVATFAFFAAFPLAVVSARSFAGLAAAYVIGGLREVGEPARKALLVDLAAAPNRGRVVGTYYAIRGFTVAGAAAVGGLLWSVRPALTFVVAAVLGAAGTLWCAVALPARLATAEASA
jgi:hypothetical protein